MDIERHIKEILVAFWYNRSTEEMEALCKEIKNRVSENNCPHTNDGDVIYSFIILMCGEYGTSPRSGWLTDIKPERLIDIITDFENMYLTED